MAISTKWKSNFSALAVVALMIAVILVPSANAQDPFEIAVGLGMGAAMSAMDLLSQGAAIRGGSELEVDVLGQQLSEKVNVETGFGEAIQERRRRSITNEGLQNSLRKKEDFQTTVARSKRAATPCGRGQGGGPPTTEPTSINRSRREASETAEQKLPSRLFGVPHHAAQRGRRPEGESNGEEPKGGRSGVPGRGSKGGRSGNSRRDKDNASTEASLASRKKRDLNEQTAEDLRNAVKRLVDAAQRLAEGVSQVFSNNQNVNGAGIPEEVEIVNN